MKNTPGYITKEEAIEFKQLCKQYLGRDLTLEEAEDQGARLIMIFEALQKSSSQIPLSGLDTVDESIEKPNNGN